jgi:hypothetical protein
VLEAAWYCKEALLIIQVFLSIRISNVRTDLCFLKDVCQAKSKRWKCLAPQRGALGNMLSKSLLIYLLPVCSIMSVLWEEAGNRAGSCSGLNGSASSVHFMFFISGMAFLCVSSS